MPEALKTAKQYRATSDGEAQSVSLAKDVFIIGCGILLIVLTYLLFANIANLDLSVIIPRDAEKVIDDEGKVIVVHKTKLDAEVIKRYVIVGLLTGSIAFLTFAALLAVFFWPKRFRHADRPTSPPAQGPPRPMDGAG